MSEEQTRQAEQLIEQTQMLEPYFADLSQREGTLFGVLKEATAAIDSLKSLGQKPESDTMVPIGMGTFVPTKISSDKKIILSIGAGVALEKDFPSAINYLEARVKEIEVALQDTVAKKQEVAARLEQCRAQINQLIYPVQPNIGK